MYFRHRFVTSSRQSDSFEHDYISFVFNQHQPQPPQLLPTDRRHSYSEYKGVKLTDFSRSWRSGLGFCAILHRYDPTLIGDFEQLDFSGSKYGQKENCKIAFDAAKTIGVERTLDESEITNYKHPDESKIISYIASLRAALQGTENVINSDKRKSEFLKVNDLSETEKECYERFGTNEGTYFKSHTSFFDLKFLM